MLINNAIVSKQRSREQLHLLETSERQKPYFRFQPSQWQWKIFAITSNLGIVSMVSIVEKDISKTNVKEKNVK